MEQLIEPGLRKGAIKIPPSKSDAQRTILAAALAKGISVIHNIGKSEDELKMLKAVQDLGAEVNILSEGTLNIKGITKFPEHIVLNCGESGLGLRLLTSVCAAFNCTTHIHGEGSLLKRPMHLFDSVFQQLEVKFRSQNGFLPFELQGPMKAKTLIIDGSQSSQYVSGLLMAMPLIQGTSYLNINNPSSIPYIQMTLNTLNSFGIEINQQNYTEYIIPGNQNYLPTTKTIEGDWSSASCWLTASALGSGISVNGLSMSSLQADKKILDAFVSAGCIIINSNEGISIDGTNRKPLDFDATHCPDLFPALVVYASLTEGISKISGVSRLKHKESDRGEALRNEFSKLGVLIEIDKNDMLIHGKKAISGSTVKSHHDHRIAMCLAIAGLYSTEKMVIESSEAVSKSYPEFWKDLNSLQRSEM